MPTLTSEALYTTKETASLLHLHPETVRIASRKGRIPSVRMGRDYRIKGETIIAMMSKGFEGKICG